MVINLEVEWWATAKFYTYFFPFWPLPEVDGDIEFSDHMWFIFMDVVKSAINMRNILNLIIYNIMYLINE